MKRIKILLAALLIVLTGTSQTISVGNVTLNAGETADVTVKLTGGNSYIATGFTVELPEGISLTGDVTNGTSSHFTRVYQQDSKKTKVAIYSSQNMPFGSNSLNLVSFKAQGTKPGTYQGKITGIEFASPSNTLVTKANVSFTITVKGDALLGDVNADGTVGIGDIVAVTNVMAGATSDAGTVSRADVNGDGSVGIGDIVAITNIMAGISGNNESTSKIVMERKYQVNKANNYCYQSASFRMDNGVQLQIRYNNTDYWQNSSSNSHRGIFIAVGRCEDVNYDWDVPECETFDEWYIGSVVTDEWVSEKIVIGDDGTVHYFMNGQDMGTHQFDLLKTNEAQNLVFAIQPYGWWTGHYHYMDDLKLTVSGTTISDNFNDGVIDRNIWQTPTNPEGVREEDGIMKTEQVQTDWPFILRSKSISMSDGSIVTLENEYADMVGTGASAWGGNGMVGWAGPQVTTSDGRTTALAELYVEPANTTGTVLEQTVTGLPNGTYKVELYANAYFTSGRGFSSSLTEGQTDAVYIFANDTKKYIPVHIGTEFSVSDEYSLTAKVTDGTLHMGMYSEKVGTNWWTIQIKSISRTSN